MDPRRMYGHGLGQGYSQQPDQVQNRARDFSFPGQEREPITRPIHDRHDPRRPMPTRNVDYQQYTGEERISIPKAGYGTEKMETSSYRAYAQQNYTAQSFNGATNDYQPASPRSQTRTSERAGAAGGDMYGSARRVSGQPDPGSSFDMRNDSMQQPNGRSMYQSPLTSAPQRQQAPEPAANRLSDMSQRSMYSSDRPLASRANIGSGSGEEEPLTRATSQRLTRAPPPPSSESVSGGLRSSVQESPHASPSISSSKLNFSGSNGVQRPAFTDRPSPAGRVAGDESAEGGLDRGPVIGRIRLGELSGNSNMDKQKESVLSKERKPDNDEEVTKLRALLSAATSELSRQISSLNQKQGVDERHQNHLIQKQLVHLESKMHLTEAELMATKSRAEEATQNNVTLEAKVSDLERKLKEQSSAEIGALNGVNQSVELIKAKRECESVKGQFEELTQRYSLLQRSLQLLDNQKGTEAKALAEATESAEKYKLQTETLMNKQSVLQQENEMLKEQLQAELEKLEHQRLADEKENKAALARAHTVVLAQKAEIDTAREKEEELQRTMRQLEDKKSELQSLNNGLSSKEQWYLSQMAVADKREEQCSAILDRTSNKFMVTVLAKPVFTEWKDLACDARARRWTLHSLLCGIMGGWHRRFRKNHFLAWKIYAKTVTSACESKVSVIRMEVLADVFQAWSVLPHMSMQEKREMELKAEADASKTAADNAKKAAMAESASKLSAIADELQISRQHLYQAEQDKEAIRAQASQDMQAAVTEKMLQLETLQREKAKAEEALQEEVARVAQKSEELQKELQKTLEREREKAQAEEALQKEVARLTQKSEELQKTLETELQQSAQKAKQLEQTYQSQLNGKIPTEQAVEQLRQLEKKLTEEHTRKASELEEKQKAAARIAAQTHSVEVEKLQKMQRELEQQHASKMSAVESKHEDAKKHAAQAHSAEVEKLKKLQQDQEKQHKAALAAAKGQHKAELDRMLEAERKAFNSTKSELEKQLQALKAQLAKALEERKTTEEKSRYRIMELEDKMRVDVAKLSYKLRERETQLQEELQRAQAASKKELSDGAAARAAAERELNKKITKLEQDIVARLQAQNLEHEQEMKYQKNSHKKYEEELRQTFAKRDQQSLLKIEELRSTLSQREAEHKHSLEQVQQGRVDAAMKDLQAQLSRKEESLLKEHSAAKSLKMEVDRLTDREASLVAQLDQSMLEVSKLQRACQDAESRFEQAKSSSVPSKALDDLRSQRDDLTRRLTETTTLLQDSQKWQQTLTEQMEKTSIDLDLVRTSKQELQVALSQKERDFENMMNQKQSITAELNAASHTIQKREDDLSDSIQKLEVRLNESIQEADELRKSLLKEQEKNTALSQELRDANALMTEYSNQTNESTTSIKLIQDRLALAEAARQRDKEEFAQAKRDLDEALTGKEASITSLESSLSSATQRAADAQREVSDLTRALRDMEANLNHQSGLHGETESLQRRMISVENENATLTEEMDKVLQENAELRQQLDDAQLEADDLKKENGQLKTQNDDLSTQVDGLRTEHASVQLVGHPVSPALVYAQPEASTIIAPLRATRAAPPSAPAPAYARQNPPYEFTGDSRRTAGVHGLRLIRSKFDEWVIQCLDRRMEGSKTAFTALGFLTNQDGSVASPWTVARIKRENLALGKECIGSGSFAEVFKGEVKIKCAVKRMRSQTLPQHELNNFVREGEMMRVASEHPNIVKLLGIHHDNGTYSLIQEFIQGTNLFDFMHKFNMKIPISRQLLISVQVCDAMTYLHEMRILHRDLKSQNVIYQEAAGICKLCDFGLARLMPPGLYELDPAQLGTGGTPAYQGPEVLKRQNIGFRVDLYGFGIMIWEMYTSKLPWSDCTLEQMTHKVAIANERPPLPKDMPVEYCKLMQRCWASEPAQRPEFWTVLPILEGLRVHHPVPPSPHLSVAPSPMGSKPNGVTQPQAQARKPGQSQQLPVPMQQPFTGTPSSAAANAARSVPYNAQYGLR